MPKFAEFADRVLSLVAEELEVPKEQILSKSRRAETVDARHTAVMLMYCHHAYPSRIADVFRISARSVRHIITCFDARTQTNTSLRNNMAKIRKQLGDNSEAIRQ